MAIYTLTDDEASRYDAADPELMNELRDRFGLERNRLSGSTTILHPDGFVIAHLGNGKGESNATDHESR